MKQRFKAGTVPTKRQKTAGYSILSTLHILNEISAEAEGETEKRYLTGLMKEVSKLLYPLRLSVSLDVAKEQLIEEMNFGIDTLKKAIENVEAQKKANYQGVELQTILEAAAANLKDSKNVSSILKGLKSDFSSLAPADVLGAINEVLKGKLKDDDKELIDLQRAVINYSYGFNTLKKKLAIDRYPKFVKAYVVAKLNVSSKKESTNTKGGKLNPQRLTKAQTTAIVDLHSKGKTVAEISDAINLVEPKIQAYIDNNIKT